MVSILFDLYSSPLEKGYIETLRDEIICVMEGEKGVWTRGGLDKMVKMESALRESMRHWGSGPRIITRKVTKRLSLPHLHSKKHLPLPNHDKPPILGDGSRGLYIQRGHSRSAGLPSRSTGIPNAP